MERAGFLRSFGEKTSGSRIDRRRIPSGEVRFGDTQSHFGSTADADRGRCQGAALVFNVLEAARRLFGRIASDRLFYTVVAPTAMKSTTTSSSGHFADDLRAEQGCR
jgi:hypothetical protein